MDNTIKVDFNEDTSSFITGLIYENNHNLTVKFKNNKAYKYFDVPLFVVNDMLSAESKGKFLHQCLKDRYKGEAVSEQPS